jgi:hypothetical protein
VASQAPGHRRPTHMEGGDLRRRACPAPALDALALARSADTLQGGKTRRHCGVRVPDWRATCRLGNRQAAIDGATCLRALQDAKSSARDEAHEDGGGGEERDAKSIQEDGACVCTRGARVKSHPGEGQRWC